MKLTTIVTTVLAALLTTSVHAAPKHLTTKPLKILVSSRVKRGMPSLIIP